LSQKVEDLKRAELLEQQGFEVVTDEVINKQIQASSVTAEPLLEQLEKQPEPTGRMGWVSRWGEWVRASFLAATDGCQYRMLIEQVGGWIEVLAFPHEIRWDRHSTLEPDT
jgi:hypothetical protein